MQKVIRQDIKTGWTQITIADERYYFKQKPDSLEYVFYPSVTWISSFYPKGIAFYKWLASKGWNEAEAIKEAASNKGSKVHYAIKDLLEKKVVKMDSKYMNPSTMTLEELTIEEYECLLSFMNWFNQTKPEVIGVEFTIFNKDKHYGGTIDLLCKINKEVYVIDFKTSANVWPEHELQISAYKHALDDESIKMAILQLGYNRNKAGYKFTDIEDKFELFLGAYKVWENEIKEREPKRKDYPSELKLIA
jgi:hypothetical protein